MTTIEKIKKVFELYGTDSLMVEPGDFWAINSGTDNEELLEVFGINNDCVFIGSDGDTIRYEDMSGMEQERVFDYIKCCVRDVFSKKHGYVIVTWPESQCLMTKSGLDEHIALIDDGVGYEIFGDSAYVVDEDWYNNLDNIPEISDEEETALPDTWLKIAEVLEDEDGFEYYTIPE